MLLTYGPLADWFITVDRVLYDQVASFLPNKSLDDAVIFSIDPSRVPAAELLEQYELVIERLRQADVRRIIMPNPPEIGAADPLPGRAIFGNAILKSRLSRIAFLISAPLPGWNIFGLSLPTSGSQSL